jgi:hypothetical protein
MMTILEVGIACYLLGAATTIGLISLAWNKAHFLFGSEE